MQQFLLGDVQDLDLELVAGFALVHQILEPAPGAFQLLERRVVHDFVELERNQVIDLRDARVDHHLGVARDGHGAIQHLRDELLDQVLAALLGCRFDAEAAFLDNLVEQSTFRAPAR